MSALGRLISRSSVARRSYSSFGGGRYFNSSKPPKTPVVAAKNKSDTAEGSSKDAAANTPSAAQTANSSNPNSSSNNAKATTSATSPEPSNDQGLRKPSISPSAYLGTPPTTDPYHNYLGPHPNVNAKDFKIHQFFSLHRPLLLISNPQTVFTPPSNSTPLFRSSILDSVGAEKIDGDRLPPAPSGVLNLDGTYGYNANVDEDAETARQLHYAMTMHRVASVATWEETLKNMGLDVSQDAERVQLREQMDKEWEEVMMDSVKRKRKKKMKKHK
jgi:hypothetical protein